MSGSSESSSSNSAAPADARPHAKWPRWRIVLAYAALTAVACASIWFVDRSAMKVQNESLTSEIVPSAR